MFFTSLYKTGINDVTIIWIYKFYKLQLFTKLIILRELIRLSKKKYDKGNLKSQIDSIQIPNIKCSNCDW